MTAHDPRNSPQSVTYTGRQPSLVAGQATGSALGSRLIAGLTTCSVLGCSMSEHQDGLCRMHAKWNRPGRPATGQVDRDLLIDEQVKVAKLKDNLERKEGMLALAAVELARAKEKLKKAEVATSCAEQRTEIARSCTGRLTARNRNLLNLLLSQLPGAVFEPSEDGTFYLVLPSGEELRLDVDYSVLERRQVTPRG